MNHPRHPALRISYRMQRSDYVALKLALSEPRVLRILLGISLYPACLILVLLLTSGSWAGFVRALLELVAGQAPLWIYLLLLAGPALALLHPQILGLKAATTYKRNALADREVTLDFTAHGIDGDMTDVQSRIGWNAVTRLIETPTHLFIAVSRREALIVPRRAVPDEDNYKALLGFVRARTAASLGK